MSAEVVKIASAAVVTCFLAVLLKQYKSEYAMAVTICGGVVIFIAVVPQLAQLFAGVRQFADKTGIGRDMLSPAFKTIGIAYITGYAAEMCRDAGENALAAKLEMAGKILMLAIALPVAMAMFDAIERILP
ncbi:MAG: stage III sporulation protein AD [Clostridia bacterium]|nr:stage III sporulation protein AD [Clostridia bacterium]